MLKVLTLFNYVVFTCKRHTFSEPDATQTRSVAIQEHLIFSHSGFAFKWQQYEIT